MTSILYQPEEITETLLYLDYIGGVTEGKKLFLKEMTYVGDTDYYLRYKRYMEGESIDTQMVFIKKLFNRYIKLKNSFDSMFKDKLEDAYRRFHHGICVLSLTYRTNKKLNKFCALMDDYEKMSLSQH
jgi:hypothetical protein